MQKIITKIKNKVCMNRFWYLLVMMSTLIIIDQMTKGIVQTKFYLGETLPIIEGFFNLTYVRNTGAAWGFGQGFNDFLRISLFLVLPVGVCGYLFFWLIKTIKGPWHISLALGLILAGAVGNLIDRFSLKYVVDFLDFYYGSSHFPAFNVADSCITVGAILLFIEYGFIEPKRLKKNATKS